nr:PREDICTED: probable cation-transporting ATPase 13A5 [Anolis carolinensis]|eukprot:XP_016854555.1 PREDICTED: probable cation-transporting ATPase 13A5 [Anolis carolinensis]
MSIWLGISVFILFADTQVVYKGLQLLCIPTHWRVCILVMMVVRFAISFFVEDAVLENHRLWLWVKARFQIRSSSKYRKLQRQMDGDVSWPPRNHRDFAADGESNGKSEVYINPCYENGKED